MGTQRARSASVPSPPRIVPARRRREGRELTQRDPTMVERIEPKSSLAETLHRLIDVCRDSERIFADAAKRTPDPELQAAFRDLAGSRREMIEELKPHLGPDGDEPAERGTVPGKLRLVYTHVEDALGAQDLPDLLDHLVAIEGRASDAFAGALESEGLSDPLRAALRRMHGTLELTKDTLRRLGGQYS